MAATAQAPSRSTSAGNGGGNADLLDEVLKKPVVYDREMQLVRMENETIMSECKVHPRDFDTIKADLLKQLRAFPDMATDAIYEKPVGKDPDTGQQKYARGLSVRAAESLAEAYGYNRIRSDVSEIEGDKVKIEATFTDFQKGRIWQDAGILSKTYKDRRGAIQRINDDRFYNVVVKAEVSKRVREVILRSVNAGLKAWFEAECEKLSAGLLDDETIAKIVRQYETKAVTVEMLETLIGRPRSMGWTQTDRQRLLSIWNALKDGETSVAEVFADKPPMELPTPTKEPPKAPKSADPSAVDQEAVDRATLKFLECTSEKGLDYELENLPTPPNAATESAITVAANERRAAIKEAAVQPAGKKTQKALT